MIRWVDIVNEFCVKVWDLYPHFPQYLHYTTKIYDVINEYFDVACGGTVLPILVITGNTHPVSYCMSKPDNRVFLTIEAFRSGPIKVTVVRSPEGEDFFYVEDSQLSGSNDECPNFWTASILLRLDCPWIVVVESSVVTQTTSLKYIQMNVPISTVNVEWGLRQLHLLEGSMFDGLDFKLGNAP